MPDDTLHILSTRPLDESLITRAGDNNIIIDSVSFIRTEQIRNDILEKQIADAIHHSSTVVFTSMNAADAVADYAGGNLPQWNIYCLGTATKEIILNRFPLSHISGEADNASSLADAIIRNDVQEVIFFCGDQRRDELPGKLANQNIAVEEMIVYKTIATPEKMEKEYSGILFFSPSAVESFFSVNSVSEDTILFSIGSTTSDCIKLYCTNKIIQSDLPGKKNLAEKVINYFGKSNHTNEYIKK
ncbi:MAG: uroporphyrinogen-III synthase [Chitinophagaceae bacterium]